MKICSKCKLELPVERFYKGARYRDGYRGVCISCFHKTTKKKPVVQFIGFKICSKCNQELSLKNFSKKKQIAYEFCRACTKRHKKLARTRVWIKKNPEKIRARQKKYQKTHPEKSKVRQQRWRDCHFEENKTNIANLCDSYVKSLLRHSLPIRLTEIPPSLIEAKRLQLKLYRLIKEKINDQHAQAD